MESQEILPELPPRPDGLLPYAQVGAVWEEYILAIEGIAKDAVAQLRAANERAAVSEEHNEGLARVLGCGSQHYKVAAAVILLMQRAEEAEAKLAALLEAKE